MAPCEPDQATTHSSDRSITPGQLNSSPASVSGRDQRVSSSSSNQATPSITEANPPGQTPDRSSVHRAAHESSGVSSAKDTSLQAGRQWDKALALDLVSHCLASGVATWPGPLPSLGQLCQLAVEASHALEVTGHPVMALEALQIAQMCCKRLVSHESNPGSDRSTQSSSQSSTPTSAHDSQHQQHILSSWQERLVTACLVRCLVDATAPVPPLDPLLPPGAPLNPQDAQHFISQRWTLHCNRALPTATLPDAGQWKKLAQQQLRVISDAGIQVNTDQTMARLQIVHDSLLALTSVGGEEAVGVEVGGTGLFRSISGMSAMSTPRRDSTLSRLVLRRSLTFRPAWIHQNKLQPAHNLQPTWGETTSACHVSLFAEYPS